MVKKAHLLLVTVVLLVGFLNLPIWECGSEINKLSGIIYAKNSYGIFQNELKEANQWKLIYPNTEKEEFISILEREGRLMVASWTLEGGKFYNLKEGKLELQYFLPQSKIHGQEIRAVIYLPKSRNFFLRAKSKDRQEVDSRYYVWDGSDHLEEWKGGERNLYTLVEKIDSRFEVLYPVSGDYSKYIKTLLNDTEILENDSLAKGRLLCPIGNDQILISGGRITWLDSFFQPNIFKYDLNTRTYEKLRRDEGFWVRKVLSPDKNYLLIERGTYHYSKQRPLEILDLQNNLRKVKDLSIEEINGFDSFVWIQ